MPLNDEERARIQRMGGNSLTCLNVACSTVWFGLLEVSTLNDRCPSCNCIGVEDPDGNEPASDAIEQEWKRLNPGINTRRDFRL